MTYESNEPKSCKIRSIASHKLCLNGFQLQIKLTE